MRPEFDIQGLKSLIRIALEEDLGTEGDITSRWTLPASAQGTGVIIGRENGIVAGIPVVEAVFDLVGSVECNWNTEDGSKITPGTILGKIQGPLRAILTGERTALNFIQRLSGIATAASRYVDAVAGTGAVILDTRKTTPGLRKLEKYAVTVGGAANHRMGLYDMVLIKDNHIDGAGSIGKAVTRCLENMKKENKRVKIEVETRNLDEVREALRHPIDRIMLDNMDCPVMKEAVRLISGRVEVEASGNMTLERVREVAMTGVDCISVGALTHSARSLDIALELIQ